MDEWKSFSGLSNIALDPTNLRDHKPQINEQRIDREMWVMLDKWILNCKMSYFLDIFWLLTSWSHRRQRLKYRMEQEQTTTGLWRENTTCNIRLPAVASFFILMGKKHLLWKNIFSCGFHIYDVHILRIHNIQTTSLTSDVRWWPCWTGCVPLPDGHEIEDVGHSRAVTKQITQAELEDYSGHQDTVPAHK